VYPVQPSAKGSPSAVAALAIRAAVLGALSLSVGCSGPATGVSRQRAALVSTLAQPRPCEGRLGGLPYTTWGARPPRLRPGAGKAILAIRRAASDPGAGPAAIADHALIHLLAGKPGLAVTLLEKALPRVPSDPLLLGDLAAAYLERGRVLDQPLDFVLAATTAARAVAAQPRSAEARFNLALALTRSRLLLKARRQWLDYLAIDLSSPWAAEARSHLQEIDALAQVPAWEAGYRTLIAAASRRDQAGVRGVVARFRQDSRVLAEEKLLGAWAEAATFGRSREAQQSLDLARMIGDGLAAADGDEMVRRAVAEIDHARPGSRTLFRLRGGHFAYRQGLREASARGSAEALARFEASRTQLAAAGSPFAAWAGVQCAISHHYRGEYPQVLAALAGVETVAASGSYPALKARSRRIGGLAHLKLGDLGRSLALYSESLGIYESMGEIENAIAVHVALAESLRLQGEKKVAWRHRQRALTEGSRLGDWLQVHNALFDAAEALLAASLPEATLLFQDEMVAGARRRGDAIGATEALVRRARTKTHLGDAAGAGADLAQAQGWLDRLPNWDQRPGLGADLAAVLGESLLRSEPRRAARVLEAAIASYVGGSQAFRLPRLYRELGLARESLGDVAGAEASLDRAIVECEAERRTIEVESLTRSYLDQAQGLYDEMIRLQVERRGDAEAAFSYVEKSRAGTLFDAIAALPGGEARRGMAGAALSAAEVGRRMPAGTALVEYALLPDQLLAWVITARGFRLVPTAMRRPGLADELARFRSRIDAGVWDVEAQHHAELLYDVLVRPLASSLHAASSVVVVPDQELDQVPFALLRNAATGRFLVEDLALSYAPSASLWAQAAVRATARGTLGVLAVGDPAFDARAFPQLARLNGARAEASSVAALYPVSKLLTGAAATPEALLQQAPRFAVVHLASHTLGSAFVLAPGAHGKSDLGLLEARDIYRLRLARTLIVVLAACGTAAGPREDREGPMSLARPFLAAGAPLVLASLWKVDDATTAELLDRFHRQVLRRRNPVTALQEVQLAALRSPFTQTASPLRWGTFVILGAAPAGAQGSGRLPWPTR
jgi:CHAT domain-containing protein/tetratricopeptide (TPR) repeat protein